LLAKKSAWQMIEMVQENLTDHTIANYWGGAVKPIGDNT